MANTTGKKFGGRQKGSPNKSTLEIKLIAQEHGARAIELLADLMVNAQAESTKVAAAKELLDRGYGKSSQAITGEGGAPLLPPIIQFVIDEDSTHQTTA